MPTRQASNTNDTYKVLYRSLLWGKESTIQANLAAHSYRHSDLRLLEVACGISSVAPDTAWYRIDKKISQFCINTWMRLFRKNVVRLLLTEGCIPSSKEAQDYCKPIIEALLEKYHNIHPLSTEHTSKKAILIRTAQTLGWDNLVQIYARDKKTSNDVPPPAQVKPNQAESEPSEPSEPSAPSEPSEPKSSLLPAFEASSKIINGVEPYAENEQRGGGELRPHDPKKSTKTATSHYLNIKMVD